MFDFTSMPIGINLAIFAVAAVVVWFAGARITGYANAISNKTGIGQAAIGMLLLGGVTSLPEIGATVTGAATGAALLAVNNLFGSIAAQVVILAIVDIVIGRKALTSELPDPTVMLQGGLNILLISIAAAGITVGDIGFLGIGLWAWVSIFAYAFSIYILSRTEGARPWLAASHGEVEVGLEEQHEKAKKKAGEEHAELPLGRIIAWTVGLGLVILVAGYVLARTGDALAQQTGLGGSAVGFVLLAFATSMPEFSTAITAAKSGLYTLAVSDIFGTNLINIGLIFIIDMVAPGEPVLSQAGTFDAFGALLGIVVTALFLVGMAERRDKTVLRMGLDSLAVLLCYGAGLVVLYFLR